MSQVSATAFKFCAWKSGSLSWCCCKAGEGHLHCSLTISVSHVSIQSPKEKAAKCCPETPRAPGVQADEDRRQTASKGPKEQEAMLTQRQIRPRVSNLSSEVCSFLQPIPAWPGRFPLQASQGIQNTKTSSLQVIKTENATPCTFQRLGLSHLSWLPRQHSLGVKGQHQVDWRPHNTSVRSCGWDNLTGGWHWGPPQDCPDLIPVMQSHRNLVSCSFLHHNSCLTPTLLQESEGSCVPRPQSMGVLMKGLSLRIHRQWLWEMYKEKGCRHIQLLPSALYPAQWLSPKAILTANQDPASRTDITGFSKAPKTLSEHTSVLASGFCLPLELGHWPFLAPSYGGSGAGWHVGTQGLHDFIPTHHTCSVLPARPPLLKLFQGFRSTCRELYCSDWAEIRVRSWQTLIFLKTLEETWFITLIRTKMQCPSQQPHIQTNTC